MHPTQVTAAIHKVLLGAAPSYTQALFYAGDCDARGFSEFSRELCEAIVCKALFMGASTSKVICYCPKGRAQEFLSVVKDMSEKAFKSSEIYRQDPEKHRKVLRQYVTLFQKISLHHAPIRVQDPPEYWLTIGFTSTLLPDWMQPKILVPPSTP